MNKKIFKIIGIVIALILLVGLTIYLWPFFQSLGEDEVRKEFIEKIRNSWYGIFIFLGLQIIQVLVAFIPGEVVEVMAGIIYGPFLGLLWCIVGISIATIIIWVLVKLLGANFINNAVSKKDLKKFAFINDSKRVEFILFFLTFMPLVPKDIFLYLAPLSKIKLHRFLIINAIARIPSILTSTLAGESLLEGNIVLAIIIYGVNFLIGILCIIFHKRIIEFLERINKKTVSQKNE